MRQRATRSTDTDRMMPVAHAFFILPTVIVVELGAVELHVEEGEAVWIVGATGRRLTPSSPRSRWPRA